jgi:hypothetical protein
MGLHRIGRKPSSESFHFVVFRNTSLEMEQWIFVNQANGDGGTTRTNNRTYNRTVVVQSIVGKIKVRGACMVRVCKEDR